MRANRRLLSENNKPHICCVYLFIYRRCQINYTIRLNGLQLRAINRQSERRTALVRPSGPMVRPSVRPLRVPSSIVQITAVRTVRPCRVRSVPAIWRCFFVFLGGVINTHLYASRMHETLLHRSTRTPRSISKCRNECMCVYKCALKLPTGNAKLHLLERTGPVNTCVKYHP